MDRVAIETSLTPWQVLGALRDDPRPFALTGSWAESRAIVGSAPLEVAPAGEDPIAVFARRPLGAGGDGAPPGDEGAPPDRSGDGAPRGHGAPPGVYGGWFGWVGYGAAVAVDEHVPQPPRPIPLPQASLAFYDHVLRLDSEGAWWFETLDPARLADRLPLLRRRLGAPPPRARPFSLGAFRARPTPEAHREAVRDCLDRIAAGDLFQANLALRLEAPFEGSGLDLFARAAPALAPAHGAYFAGERHEVASLSPELFLRRRGREVRTEPIKGTAPRSSRPAELAASAKDRAENIMIVDLMRNDLGRVAEYGSVEVPALANPEAHTGVWHLISTVRARLRPGVDDAELLRATLPPGSVTGAPKLKSLEVIAALESTGRELYTGVAGYASPVAGLELSVAIRSFEIAEGRIWLGAGGGVVADSDPEGEYREALTKAEPLIAAAGGRIEAPGAGAPGRGGIEGIPRAPHPVTGAVGGRASGEGPVPARRSRRPDPDAGVFTTVLALEGTAVAAAEHVERLARSAETLYGMRLRRDALLDRLQRAAAEAPSPASLRVDLLPGAPPAVSARPLAPADRFPAALTRLRPVVVPGGLGEHKWRDRELIEAVTPAGAEPLIVDLDGVVLESGWGNVWIVEGDAIATPPADGRLLPGVTRAQMLELASASVEELTLARLEAADEVFVTSSLRGIQLARGRGGVASELAPALAARDPGPAAARPPARLTPAG